MKEVIHAEVVEETADAIRIQQHGELYWLPKSCCNEDVAVGDTELMVESWLVDQKGLE